jgi:PiT family inorganic phosphate transporter
MPELSLLLVLIVLVSLAFDYTNGANDCANAIATVVSTKVLTPRQAVLMAAGFNMVGALLGTEVAETMGKGIIRPEMIMGSQLMVLAAVIGAASWNGIATYYGWPISASHALIGGLVGAGLAFGGWSTLNLGSIAAKVIVPLVLSPIFGFLGGYLLLVGLAWSFRHAQWSKSNLLFRKLQLVSSGAMALSHGMNDAQKTMGIITLALFISHWIPAMVVPLWVKLTCALVMGLGTAVGGWKVIRTMGHNIFKLEPFHGFAAETSAALVIAGASQFGAPISTTHIISTSIMGVGASKRFSAVRWGVAGHLVVAWILTIPASAAVSAVAFWTLSAIGLAD